MTENINSIHITRLSESDNFNELMTMIHHSIESQRFAQSYPQASVNYLKSIIDENTLKLQAQNGHFYIAKCDNKIVGCGLILRNKSNKKICKLKNIFVDRDFQGKGIGKQIITTLENDEYFNQAKKIEVASSIPAIPFYKKMGYTHKDNRLIYKDGTILLEKLRD